MKYQDSAEADQQIAAKVAEDKATWALIPGAAPPPSALIAALDHDLRQRAAKLKAYSYMSTARNLAAELEKHADDLRQSALVAQHSQQPSVLLMLGRDVGQAFQALLMGSYTYRELLKVPPKYAEVPKVMREIAPPKRGAGAPRRPDGLEKYAAEPWYNYLPRRRPGRPAKNEVPMTEEQKVLAAKKAWKEVTKREEEQQARESAKAKLQADRAAKKPNKRGHVPGTKF